MEEPNDFGGVGGLGKTRVEALTDGVFAIAMTVLVFGITIPNVPQGAPAPVLQRSLWALWPKFLTYAISFVVLGIYWVGHHNQFHYIRRTDRTLLWINIFFLLSIGLIPFSTALMGQYPMQRTAVIVYGGNLILVGFFLFVHWWYATDRSRLVDADIHPDVVALAKRRILVGPVAFLAAIGLSFFDTTLAIGLYALTPVLYIMPGRIDLHWARVSHGRPKIDRD